MNRVKSIEMKKAKDQRAEGRKRTGDHQHVLQADILSVNGLSGQLPECEQQKYNSNDGKHQKIRAPTQPHRDETAKRGTRGRACRIEHGEDAHGTSAFIRWK